jgi:O-antigen/teichoic acid export membrane protein
MIHKFKSLLKHKGFIKYFKNTSWVFVEKIIRLAVGLFVGVWVARYLGPERFGLLSYAQSFVGLFTVIASLGLDGIVVRELVKNNNLNDEIIGTAFWLKVIAAFGVLLILSIAINLTSNDTYTNILIFIIASATIFQSFNVVDFYFQSKVMSKFVVYVNIISLFLSSIVKITLILNQASLVAFAWAILFDSFILACGFIYFYIKKNLKFKIKNLKLKIKTATSLLKDSWPLILSGITISIYMRIDQVMIKEMMNAEAVGQYAAAVRLSEVWYFIPVTIAASLFPAIIYAKKVSEKLYYRRLQKLYDFNFFVALILGLPVIVFSNFIVELLYGQQFNQSAQILSIHMFCGFLVFMGVVRGKWMLNENLQRYDLFIHIIGAIANIIFNYIFISLLGIIGAAYGTLLSYIFTLFFSSLIIKKIRPSFYMILHGYKNVLTLQFLKKEYFNA